MRLRIIFAIIFPTVKVLTIVVFKVGASFRNFKDHPILPFSGKRFGTQGFSYKWK